MDGESDSEGSSFFARMRKSARPRASTIPVADEARESETLPRL